MMGAPTMKGATLAPRARLDAGKFRFLCRLSRLAPGHQAHALFNGAGGALQSGTRRKP